MSSIAIPLRIRKGGLVRTQGTKEAIDEALALLIGTPCNSSPADPAYGFVFNNLRFESLNENEGVVYNSAGRGGGLYEMKVSGSSNNLNTFAAELKRTIQVYEKRLTDVAVTMTYMREERRIYITVRGKIAESGEKYQYISIINVWK